MEKKYDFTKFSEEDRREYAAILDGLPYMKELEEFFYTEKKRYERDERRRRRYMTDADPEMLAGLPARSPGGRCHAVSPVNFGEVMKSIPRRERSRVTGYYLDGKSVRSIARDECCSASAVYSTLRKFRDTAKREYRLRHGGGNSPGCKQCG